MKTFLFSLTLIFSSLSFADVWYNCESPSSFPSQFRVEIKSEMWARITMGEEDKSPVYCIAKRRFDYSFFDNIDEEYSAVSRSKECNLSFQSFAQRRSVAVGSFTLISLQNNMLSESTAQQKGRATILTSHFPGSQHDRSDYVCTRIK